MQRLILPGMILLGLTLVILGSAWNWLNPAANYWSEAQAKELTEAQIALHSHSHEHGPGGKNSESHAFGAAKERFDKIKGELDGARNSRRRTGNILIGIGLVAVISAAVLHYRGYAQDV